ncbi:hypothetical protein Alg130_12468 [Pyrenophora tritici-repentis]|nr:hypothetical protein Alg130_12468 [Pyrenophora tritici-repentis]
MVAVAVLAVWGGICRSLSRTLRTSTSSALGSPIASIAAATGGASVGVVVITKRLTAVVVTPRSSDRRVNGLDWVVAAGLVNELAAHAIDVQSNVAAQISAAIASVVRVGVVDSKNELIHSSFVR